MSEGLPSTQPPPAASVYPAQLPPPQRLPSGLHRLQALWASGVLTTDELALAYRSVQETEHDRGKMQPRTDSGITSASATSLLPQTRWHRTGRRNYVVEIDHIRSGIVAFHTVDLLTQYELDLAWFLGHYIQEAVR
jgi:hypothetical protein